MKEATIDHIFYGYFISRDKNPDLIGEETYYDDQEYLHCDGIWRETATNELDELTGYYTSLGEAQLKLDTYNLNRRPIMDKLSRFEKSVSEITLTLFLEETAISLEDVHYHILLVGDIAKDLGLDTTELDNLLESFTENVKALDFALEGLYNILTRTSEEQNTNTGDDGDEPLQSSDAVAEVDSEVGRFESEGGRTEVADQA